MKKMSKVCALLLALTMVISFAGCGKDKETVAFVDNDEFYTIDWYYLCPNVNQKDVEPVQEELNKYLRKKINAEVRMNVFDWASYDQRLNLMLQSGEKIDLCYTSGTKYQTYVSKAGFIELDGLLEKYAPKLAETLDKNLMEGSKINGKMYGIPANKEAAHSYGFIYRKDIADELGIDMTKVKSFFDIEPILKQVKEKYPDMYPIVFGGANTPLDELDFESYCLKFGNFPGDDSGKIVNLYETKEYQERAELAYDFVQKGYVGNETGVQMSDLVSSGKVFMFLSPLKPDKADEYNASLKIKGAEFEQIETTPVRTYTSDCTGSLMAIPISSKNPARVMKFLELLNTDPYVNNLVNYGIEGKDYTKLDDGRIHISEDTKYKTAGNQWMLGNTFINLLTDKQDINRNKDYMDFNSRSTEGVGLGFAFDVEPVKNQVTAVTNVIAEYNDRFRAGTVSIDDGYDKFVSKMKKAGSDDILAEVQKQYDAWKKTK